MKIYSLLSCVGICLGVSGIANAKIVTGYSEGYFSKMYATDLSGKSMPQYDGACQSKHWSLMDTYFYADFRINTESNQNYTFMRYANAETQLTNAGGFNVQSQKYEFTSDNLPPSLKNMDAKSMVFTLDYAMRYATAKVVFNPVTVQSTGGGNSCNCNCGCHPNLGNITEITYQCVLSTH